MTLEMWLDALQTDLLGETDGSDRSRDQGSTPLTWVAADPEAETDDASPSVECIDREPRGADDETVAAAVPDTDRDSHTRCRPEPERQADDETVAAAVRRVERSRQL